MSNNHTYSVVVPVYNSEKTINATVTRIRDFFLSERISFEIILVDDGSHDDSWKIIADLARNFPDTIAISLLKNYGQHSANLCGFRVAKGDFVVTMDDDL